MCRDAKDALVKGGMLSPRMHWMVGLTAVFAEEQIAYQSVHT